MRFLASMAVFFAHSVAFFVSPGAPVRFGPLVENAGYYGVLFFYCLSGFLITFLLLREKEESGTICIRQFYARRALRIWPLYFLMTLLSFLVFRHFLPAGHEAGANKWGIAFALYLLFLPNIAVLTGYYSSTNFQLYTIGFEEQFYLIWPWVIRRARKRPVRMLAALFFVPLAIGIFHAYAHEHGLLTAGKAGLVARAFLTYIDYSNLPAFAAGGAAAYWYRGAGAAQLRRIGNASVGYVLVTALLVLMWLGMPQTPGYVNLLAVLFVLLILHLLSREKEGADGGLLASGGRISYGIYVYHPAILLLVSWCLGKVPVLGTPVVNYLLFVFISLVVVLVVSSVSYRVFERRFLRKKAGIAKMIRKGEMSR
jgi:peptidoglycan/LPS O-acetylase OafA/YrhL